MNAIAIVYFEIAQGLVVGKANYYIGGNANYYIGGKADYYKGD
jgi:hypothetical protein